MQTIKNWTKSQRGFYVCEDRRYFWCAKGFPMVFHVGLSFGLSPGRSPTSGPQKDCLFGPYWLMWIWNYTIWSRYQNWHLLRPPAEVLRGLVVSQGLIYINDISVGDKTIAEHKKWPEEILKPLESTGLKLSSRKCHFPQRNVIFLGHLIIPGCIETDLYKAGNIQ